MFEWQPNLLKGAIAFLPLLWTPIVILPSLFAMLHFYPRFVKTNTQSTPLYNSVRCLCKKKLKKKEKTGLEVCRTKISFHSPSTLLSIPMRSRPSIAGATLGRSAGAAPAAERRGSGGWSARPAPRLGGVEGPLAARPGECWAARLARSGSAGGRAAARLPVSILVLGAAAVFFEHIRKIGCMHS